MFESLQLDLRRIAKSGKVRALAVSGATRSPAFPDLPTIARGGVPGYLAPTWSGVIGAGRRAAPDRRQAQRRDQPALIQSDAFKERFAAIGDEPAGGTPEEFAATIKADSAKWGEVIKRAGIKFE